MNDIKLRDMCRERREYVRNATVKFSALYVLSLQQEGSRKAVFVNTFGFLRGTDSALL